jgi:hypothetical protein
MLRIASPDSSFQRVELNCVQGHNCLRMLEAGVPFSVVATIMGWSSPTTVRMARRYGHNGQAAQRQAVNALKGADFGGDEAQNWAHSQKPRIRQLSN